MRRRARVLLTVPLVGVLVGVLAATTSPATAAVEVVKDPTAKLTAPYVNSPTDAVINVTLTQTSYANISLDVALAGFRAQRSFDYRKGECPTSVARVILPAKVTVTECGWEQEGDNATLRIALKGTLTDGAVKVRIKSGALTAPAAAGVYGIFVSSWAFDEVSTTTQIASGPLK